MPEVDDKKQEGGQGGGAGGGQQAPAQTFDAWLASQGDDVKALVAEGTRGLKNALDSEREQRRKFEKDLRDATAKLDKDSDARKQLETLTGQMETEGRRAEFYEAAHAAGVTNLKLAWLAVQQDENLMDRKGQVDLEKLKKGFPELFGARPAGKPAAGNAGSGTGGDAKKGDQGMNQFIRQAAGRS